MATSIYQKRLISKRQEQGLCPTCGKPLDRDGYYCTECNIKHNQYQKETKDWRNLPCMWQRKTLWRREAMHIM